MLYSSDSALNWASRPFLGIVVHLSIIDYSIGKFYNCFGLTRRHNRQDIREKLREVQDKQLPSDSDNVTGAEQWHRVTLGPGSRPRLTQFAANMIKTLQITFV